MIKPKKVWAMPKVTPVVFAVSDDWMRACGYRDHPGVWYAVLDVYTRGGRGFVDVVNPAGSQYQPFTIACWLRDGKFIEVGA